MWKTKILCERHWYWCWRRSPMCALQIVYFKDGGQGSEGESLDDDVNVEALADVGQCTGSGVRDAPTNKEHVNNYD